MADFDAKQPIRGLVADLETKVGDGTTTLAVAVDGSTAKTNGVQILGTDGTNAQIISTDSSGQVNVNLKDAVIATPASAVVAKALQISGTDGTNARILKTDTDGNLQVDVLSGAGNDQFIDGATATPATDKGTVVMGKDGSGDYQMLSTDTSGILNVNVVSSVLSGGEISNYDLASEVAAAGSDTHTYTVTTGKTLRLKGIFASASGRMRIEIKAGTPSSETTRAVFFNSASNPNINVEFAQPIEVVAADNVLIVRKNLDLQTQDLYSTIIGEEV